MVCISAKSHDIDTLMLSRNAIQNAPMTAKGRVICQVEETKEILDENELLDAGRRHEQREEERSNM